jgi:N-acetylglucosaminyl-diphospho-decaprenol L-rhamnosyltransferase
MRPTVFIPNFNGAARIGRALDGLRRQDREVDMVVVDNGSTDGSLELLRGRYPEVSVVELGANLGFGTALNRGVAARPQADPIVLLNDDAEPEREFVGALLEALVEGVDSVAAVMTQEADPWRIDSAGVVADRTLMGFDYLHGEPVEAAVTAAAPLGPTGGAALYRRAAFEAVGGFDERIFLYYEDLDLALRMAAAGSRCALSPAARVIHAYSQSLGAASGAKYARTGWTRGYMLRRYGVMRDPALALRVLAAEGAICAGQLLRDRTTSGLRGRVRGYREGGGEPRREVPTVALLDISTREAIELRKRRRG